jgi:hypothetical protein
MIRHDADRHGADVTPHNRRVVDWKDAQDFSMYRADTAASLRNTMMLLGFPADKHTGQITATTAWLTAKSRTLGHGVRPMSLATLKRRIATLEGLGLVRVRRAKTSFRDKNRGPLAVNTYTMVFSQVNRQDEPVPEPVPDTVNYGYYVRRQSSPASRSAGEARGDANHFSREDENQRAAERIITAYFGIWFQVVAEEETAVIGWLQRTFRPQQPATAVQFARYQLRLYAAGRDLITRLAVLRADAQDMGANAMDFTDESRLLMEDLRARAAGYRLSEANMRWCDQIAARATASHPGTVSGAAAVAAAMARATMRAAPTTGTAGAAATGSRA